jgi:hypothetical protein
MQCIVVAVVLFSLSARAQLLSSRSIPCENEIEYISLPYFWHYVNDQHYSLVPAQWGDNSFHRHVYLTADADISSCHLTSEENYNNSYNCQYKTIS